MKLAHSSLYLHPRERGAMPERQQSPQKLSRDNRPDTGLKQPPVVMARDQKNLIARYGPDYLRIPRPHVALP